MHDLLKYYIDKKNIKKRVTQPNRCLKITFYSEGDPICPFHLQRADRVLLSSTNTGTRTGTHASSFDLKESRASLLPRPATLAVPALCPPA